MLNMPSAQGGEVEDSARLVYLVLLLVALLSSFLVSVRGRGAEVWRALRLWGVIVAVIVLLASFRSDLAAIGQRVLAQIDPSRGVAAGGGLLFTKANDGHFWIDAWVNAVPVRFMVDTGASTVVLSPQDAKRLGFDLPARAFTGRASTANGIVATAPVRLERVAIGDFERRNVPASVNGGALSVSLLGMSLLTEFGSVRIEGDRLTLQH